MKSTPKLRRLSLLMAVTTAAGMLPSAAAAEVSSDLTISSMYLWRGLDISDSKPALQASIEYGHESGFYAGTWFSNEGTLSRSLEVLDGTGNTIGTADVGSNGASYEIDAYLGFAKSFGDFGVDVGYAAYMYPEVPGAVTDSNIKEYIVGTSYKGASLTAYINAEPGDFDDYKYYSIDYGFGAFGFHAGMTDVTSDGGDYNDIAVSYSVAENLTWTVSQASGDAIASDSPQDDPLVVVSYAVPLD